MLFACFPVSSAATERMGLEVLPKGTRLRTSYIRYVQLTPLPEGTQERFGSVSPPNMRTTKLVRGSQDERPPCHEILALTLHFWAIRTMYARVGFRRRSQGLWMHELTIHLLKIPCTIKFLQLASETIHGLALYILLFTMYPDMWSNYAWVAHLHAHLFSYALEHTMAQCTLIYKVLYLRFSEWQLSWGWFLTYLPYRSHGAYEQGQEEGNWGTYNPRAQPGYCDNLYLG
jgi:hypothetical protein